MTSASSQSSIERKKIIIWRNVILFSILHLSAVYGVYLMLFKAKMTTVVFAHAYAFLGVIGVTAGVHRLWSHRSYKARWPLRLFLVICNTIALEDSIIHWARDHRMHHKYSETDADPHNATRGFFFSHIGWLMVKKHPEIKAKSHTVDMSDLWADPLLRFQKKYYIPMILVLSLGIPCYISVLWGETLWNVIFITFLYRIVMMYNVTWLVNSAAHMWGNKPYDKNINPVQNKFVAFLTWGEGFHNYHHTFPWDYKTDEFGSSLNLTAMFIDAMAKFGLAYDLKTVPTDVIEARKKRNGDGSCNEDANMKNHERFSSTVQ